MPEKNFEVYEYETSDGRKGGECRTESQAGKFLLPELCEPRGGIRRNPKDLNVDVGGTITKSVKTMDEDRGNTRNFKPTDAKAGVLGQKKFKAVATGSEIALVEDKPVEPTVAGPKK